MEGERRNELPVRVVILTGLDVRARRLGTPKTKAMKGNEEKREVVKMG